MKKIVLFNTAIGSLNQGDYIIQESMYREFNHIFKNNFLLELSTHSPTCFLDQLNSHRNKELSKFNYGFVSGTNLFTGNRLHRENLWNFRFYNALLFPETILVGVGSGMEKPTRINKYTGSIYNRFISKHFYHSVRDERTKKLLELMGYKVLNTGCVTMWMLDKAHCKTIPQYKSNTVLFTLTDYAKDVNCDKELISLLCKNYDNVYCWIQGSGDRLYINHICKNPKIRFIPPNLAELNRFLDTYECDYIGTRLHAGIKSIQKRKRSLILAVDNRAEDIKATYHIPVIMRTDFDSIKSFINNQYKTEISINTEAIRKFKNQFDFLR